MRLLSGAHSYKDKIQSGVPQGTVLGTVLFIVFINDLEGQIANSSIGFFADDTRLTKRVSSINHIAELQEYLETVTRWSVENNMKLLKQKFELIIHKIHRANLNSMIHELPFTCKLSSYRVSDDLELYPSSALRDLGVVVSVDGSWSEHIHQISVKAKSVAAWVLSIFRMRDWDVMMTLYKSLVRSHLEYCLFAL